MKAVIDRFEGDYAVVLFGDNEIQVDIPMLLLPEGVEEGNWLKVSFELDQEGTKKQKEKIKEMLDKLSGR
ncbi:DUF3006 domain-containing protein [Dethiobacter alkaliphilus]|uniref:DUF3006 domain-containing protein n=1 Tax=Dethiobacter alkaliphilus TaxID=427926 RepID=UPI0022271EE2|nr:DUF3006 domain-containing protein [Dethiobacter alkaliphilus]MCW3490224.1 DUF3006 domain-containing protein [Dethiobacter alkaliphilus]